MNKNNYNLESLSEYDLDEYELKTYNLKQAKKHSLIEDIIITALAFATSAIMLTSAEHKKQNVYMHHNPTGISQVYNQESPYFFDEKIFIDAEQIIDAQGKNRIYYV